MSLDTAIRVVAQFSSSGLDQLKRAFQGLSQQSTVNKRALESLGVASGNTISSLRRQAQTLNSLRDQAEGGSRSFRMLTRDIETVEARLRRLQATSQSGGGLSRGGALLAGAAGGVAGVVAVQAADLARQGAQQLRFQSMAVADLVADLNLAKTALAQVSSGQQDYSQKLEFARQVSTDYSVGLQTIIQGYARVNAAAAANNLTQKETETIYRGLISSGLAFGASQEDLKSIIVATTQILSKGKISAEELSGQLGERIPGAVAKFAEATGRSLPQLSKDLQLGNVKIEDFVKFAKSQFDEYDVAARIIGSSPEKAGERLNLALTRMVELYGGFFQKVGAGFQDSTTGIINWVNANVSGFARIASGFSLLINDVKYQIKSIGQFGADYGNPSSLIAPTPPGNAAREGQFSISSRMRNQTPQEVAREQRRVRQEVEMLMGWSPTRFGEGKAGNPNLEQLAGGDAAKKLADQQKKDAEKAEKEREKVKREQIELNQLLQEQLRLNSADGAIGKDRLSQLNGQLQLIPELLKYQIRVIELQSTGAQRQLETNNATLAAKIKTQELKQEVIGIKQEITEIGKEADELLVSVFSGFLPKESALTEEVKRVKKELEDADKTAENLLTRLFSPPGGVPLVDPNSELGKQARFKITDKRSILATMGSYENPNEIGSQRLVQPDIDALKEQVTQLQNAGKELTTLDELVLKYGADWDQIDPKVRASLQALAEQKDKLEEINKVNEKQKELFTGIAESIGGGVGSALESLVSGTESWGNSLRDISRGVLQDIARQLIQISVVQPIVKGLTKAFGFADGGVMTSSGPLPLKSYARGGIANSPQLALYGEGAMNEAYVPLPDGRRIPVALQGGGGRGGNSVSVGEMNITVQNTGETLTPDAQKQIAGQVQRIVLATLINQKRSGGIL